MQKTEFKMRWVVKDGKSGSEEKSFCRSKGDKDWGCWRDFVDKNSGKKQESYW